MTNRSWLEIDISDKISFFSIFGLKTRAYVYKTSKVYFTNNRLANSHGIFLMCPRFSKYIICSKKYVNKMCDPCKVFLWMNDFHWIIEVHEFKMNVIRNFIDLWSEPQQQLNESSANRLYECKPVKILGMAYIHWNLRRKSTLLVALNLSVRN